MAERVPRLPTEVSERVGAFDRFAGAASRVAGRAWFFAFCLGLIVIWAPSIVLLGSVDTWQLVINTATTIITFLMVALLQNSQTRSDQAVQHKLNALAQGLGDLMEHLQGVDGARDLDRDRRELLAAVGLEDREGTSHNTADQESGQESDQESGQDTSSPVKAAASEVPSGARTSGTTLRAGP
ncbi:MAG: low affinity iron permease family protein [Kineosporiaceae bacterium]